jgi:hypothetical protein
VARLPRRVVLVATRVQLDQREQRKLPPCRRWRPPPLPPPFGASWPSTCCGRRRTNHAGNRGFRWESAPQRQAWSDICAVRLGASSALDFSARTCREYCVRLGWNWTAPSREVVEGGVRGDRRWRFGIDGRRRRDLRSGGDDDEWRWVKKDSVTLQQHGTLCHDLPSTLHFPSNGCNQAIRNFC